MADDTYIGMLPMQTAECNWTYYMPGGGKRGEMPCIRDLEKNTTTTFWLPEREIPLPATDLDIHVVYAGMMNRIIEIGFGENTDITWISRELQVTPNGYEGKFDLADPMATFLNQSGNYLLIRINAVPPPPISLWIE